MNSIMIAAGIFLSARVISFIAGELTESEIKKQKEIDERIDKIRSQYYETELIYTNKNVNQENKKTIEKKYEPVEDSKSIVNEHEGDFSSVCEKHTDEKRNVDQETERIREKKREIYEYLRNEAKERETDFSSFLDEIKEEKRKVIDVLRSKNIIHTPLRRSSLELLLRQLSEAQEKCYGYMQYLRTYCEEIGRKRVDEEISTFHMQLPEDYPYIGKVLWVNAEQLSGYSLDYEIPELFILKIQVLDKDAFEIIDQSVLPIMITGGSRKEYTASLEKGAFKAYELVNTHLGLVATVKKIHNNHIVLTYQNKLELFLPKDNLIKPDRFPPIHSYLTVYPVKWEYNLERFSYGNGKTGYPVTVSERKEDAGSSFAFRRFPICFTQNDLNIFMDFFDKNHLQDYDEEFLIGPVKAKEVSCKKGTILKLQFGDIPLFYIEVDEHEDRSDILRYYFRFHGLCNPEEETFSADDIFLPFDVSFSPYIAGTSDEMIKQYMDIDDLDDVSALIWDLFEEFRIQDQIRKNRDGMGYFFKWENITNQLISVLEQGDSIQLKVRWIEGENRSNIFADIQNDKELTNFINQFAQKTDSLILREWRPQFFVKDELDNRYITTVVDAGKRLRIVGKNVLDKFFEKSNYIELFASNHPYAEYQQKAALRQFRIGQVVNPIIQAACLNSSTIISFFENDKKLVPFHNNTLACNLSQKISVEQAFRERNIFLIQGPPGTGKTTVIRELVEQVFDTYQDSRVLIVSQSNVAVDNALSGLIIKYGDQTVRCGNGDKISEEFKRLRLQNRCQDYLNDLMQRKDNFDEEFFNSWLETIRTNQTYEYSPVLCELIIRNHRLIGATCVGLAKRNIGLERTEFDLVIIDEASKALPAEMLIPLVRAKKAVIIGDQKQLPPVINPILYDEEKIDLEERAISENYLFCHSFFERLYDNAPDSCKIMLDTQYRMPAVIGTAISKLFYDGKLKNGLGTEAKKPILFKSNLSFINFDGNYKFRENKDEYNQITNSVEANAAVSLVRNIRIKDPSCKIAVITPYRGQKRLISNLFFKAGIHYRIDNIYVDTVDSFQGSEADVVIFCTTRAIRPTLFFRDSKRLNVALSRAKRELIILGRLGYFYQYRKNESCLQALANYIKKNGQIIKADQCSLIKDDISYSEKNDFLLSLSDISLPSKFYIEKISVADISKKVEEYFRNGDFLEPLQVKQCSTGYVLCGCFPQYRAAQELELSECLCRIIS